MSFHDMIAIKALSMGKTSQEFTAAAQQHANNTWFLLIIAGVVWYFSNWNWALIPGVLAIFTAFKSISSTAVAMRLEKYGK